MKDIETELVKKVKKYLVENNEVFVENSVEYCGLREKIIMLPNDEPKDLYFLSYNVVVDKSNIYSTVTFFVYVDKKTEKIICIIGPQSYDIIKE
jgi:hypothetical protein